MSFESELRSHLSVATITSFVGDRIYPLLRPQESTLPAVTYTVVGVDHQANLDGIDTSLRAVSLQIDCWARSFVQVVALALAVRDRMDTAATNFTTVVEAFSGFDDYEEDAKLYRRNANFRCWFRES